MIVAVFCVAAAMIAGGAWAVFTGWELIIIERGWTQVLLGGMLFTGGLLLGGLGVLATHVKRLAAKLDRLTGHASSPQLVSDFEPGKRETAAPQPGMRPRVEAPVMPPPRPEPRVEPAAEQKGGQSGPAISALGAAAGVGTAPIWNSLLSSETQVRPQDQAGEAQDGELRGEEGSPEDTSPEEVQAEDAAVSEALVEEAPAEEVVTKEVVTEEDLAEEVLAEEAAPSPSAVDIEEAERAAELDSGFPTPDGEDSEMLWATEGDMTSVSEADGEDPEKLLEAESLEAESLEAKFGKAEGLRGDEVAEDAEAEAGEPEAGRHEAERDEAEHVIPPIEEPVAAPVGWREAEAEPELEPELYSAPFEAEETTPDAAAMPVLEETAADRFEQLPAEEEEQAEEEQPEEPAEQPERTLVGNYESGGNIYTMYSDGSIDAQTPTGNYHFASLDELKNFIAQGGEDPLS